MEAGAQVNNAASLSTFPGTNEEVARRMSRLNLFLFLVIGIVAGWLAERTMKGKGFGPVGDMIVGAIGAYLGGWLFNRLGISLWGIVGSLVAALIGAILLLFVLRLITDG
jgi:uncharacterized membrane protein YeaQ/YmgE (transglycosylase-associated protein family)